VAEKEKAAKVAELKANEAADKVIVDARLSAEADIASRTAHEMNDG
jgi:hypothetical protein